MSRDEFAEAAVNAALKIKPTLDETEKATIKRFAQTQHSTNTKTPEEFVRDTFKSLYD